MIDSTLAVSKAVVVTWVREMAATFRTRPRNIFFSGLLLLLIAAVFGSLLAITAVNGLDVTIPGELKLTVLRTSLGGSVAIAGTIAAVICITTPSSTALQTLIDLLPISKVRANVGMRMPILVVGLAFALPMSATAGLVIIRLASRWVDIFLSLTILAMIIIIVLVLGVGLFTVLHFVLRRYVRLPYNYATTVSGAIVVLASLSSVLRDILALQPASNVAVTSSDILLHRIAASVVVDPSSIANWGGLVTWSFVAVLAFVSSGHLHEQELGQSPLLILRATSPGLHSTRGSLWFAVLLAVRTSQFVMTAFLPLPILAAMWLLRAHPMIVEVLATIALIIPSIPAYFAVYGVGRILRFRWIGSMTVVSPHWWILPSILAYAIISFVFGTLIIVAEIALGFVNLGDLHELYSRMTLSIACALLGGALIPYSEEESLTITAAGLTTLVAMMATSLLVSLVTPSGYPEFGALFRLLIALPILALVFIVCQKYEDEVRRAA